MPIHEKHSGVFKVDATDAAGAVTAYTELVTVKPSGGKLRHGELFTMASRHSETTVGGFDPTMINVEVPVDPKTAASLWSVLHAWAVQTTPAARTVNFSFPDGTTGSRQLAGEFWNLGTDMPFEIEAGSAEAARASFQLKLTGAPTWSTVA